MKILTNTRSSPWDVDPNSIKEVKDNARPTYNAIRAGITPYTERRQLDYGPVKEVNSDK